MLTIVRGRLRGRSSCKVDEGGVQLSKYRVSAKYEPALATHILQAALSRLALAVPARQLEEQDLVIAIRFNLTIATTTERGPSF